MLRIYGSSDGGADDDDDDDDDYGVALTSEVGKLTQLRVLDLRHCYNLVAISAGIISRLSKIEELYLPDNFDKWGSEGNASLEELNSLRYLHILHIHLHDAANAKALLLLYQPRFSSLIKFRISVGYWDEGDGFWDEHPETINTRALRLEGVDLTSEPMILMTKAETCKLIRLEGLQKLFEERQREWFLDLKFLEVGDCNDETEHGFLLGKPKWNNQEIIEQGVGPSPFGRLKVLKVNDCRVKYLFSCSVARDLSQLELLEIEECDSIEGIVGDDDIDEQVGSEVLIFSQLKRLTLFKLRNLKCFCANTKTKSTPQPLFNQKVSPPTLEELTVDGLDNIAAIWNIQSGAVDFPCLRKLNISYCDELVNVIVSTAPMLRDLQEREQDMVSFPALEVLSVYGLHNIAAVWNIQSGAVAFPRLQKLVISDCNELVNVIVSTAPTLQDRQQREQDMVILPELLSLELAELPNIKSFCSFISNEKKMKEDKNFQVNAFFSHKELANDKVKWIRRAKTFKLIAG